jgi:hypothetical protein
LAQAILAQAILIQCSHSLLRINTIVYSSNC